LEQQRVPLVLVSKNDLDPSNWRRRKMPAPVNWFRVLYTVASETGTLA
jgi:hypothetical protein